MPTVMKPYCSRCGKHLSPAWKSKCNHCNATFAEYPPELRTENVAPGDESWSTSAPSGGGDPFLDAFLNLSAVLVSETTRRLRRRRADRRGIWLGAELVGSDQDRIRVRVDNRRDDPILLVAVGLTRSGDAAAAYRLPLADVVQPGGSIEVILDVVAAVTAAPVTERLLGRDLDRVFVQVDNEVQPVTDLLPPNVSGVLQIRRRQWVRLGRF